MAALGVNSFKLFSCTTYFLTHKCLVSSIFNLLIVNKCGSVWKWQETWKLHCLRDWPHFCWVLPGYFRTKNQRRRAKLFVLFITGETWWEINENRLPKTTISLILMRAMFVSCSSLKWMKSGNILCYGQFATRLLGEVLLVPEKFLRYVPANYLILFWWHQRTNFEK